MEEKEGLSSIDFFSQNFGKTSEENTVYLQQKSAETQEIMDFSEFNEIMLSAAKDIISSEKIFPNGMKRNSVIAQKKFKNFYLELMGEELPDFVNVDQLAKKVSIECGEKFYVIADVNKEKLKSLIQAAIKNGNHELFYNAIYDEKTNFMREAGINSPEMLKIVLQQIFPQMRYKSKSFLTEESGSLEQDIICCYETRQMQTYAQIKEKLPYADLEKIKLACSRSKELVWAKEETYALVKNLDISSMDIATSKAVLEEDFKTKGVSNIRHMVVAESKEMNADVPEVALKEAMFNQIFSTQYKKKNSNIMPSDERVNVQEMLKEYCMRFPEIDLADLEYYEKELTNKSIYALSTACEVMIRVNDNHFVQIENVYFDVYGVDQEISSFVQNQVVPLKSINSFTFFPSVSGYSWNSFMLDSFCRHKSKNFCRMGRPSKNKPVGAIFPVQMRFQNYNELLAHVLAQSTLNLQEDDAEEFFITSGYIPNKRKDTGKIVVAAQKIRMQEEITDVRLHL